jgi:hypothetical protein
MKSILSLFFWTFFSFVPSVVDAGKQAGGAVVMAGYDQAKNSLKTQGFLLFLASTIIFIISKFFGVDSFYAWASVIFMLFAALFVFKGKGAWIVLVFFFWYVILGRTDLHLLVNSLLPILVVGIIFKGLYSKFKEKQSFMAGAGGELGFGLMLIAIYFIDIGMVPWFENELQVLLPNVVHLLLESIPLWPYVGVLVMMQDEQKSALAKVCSVISIAYLVFVAVTIAPQVYGEEGVLPSPEELLSERQQQQKIYSECQLAKFGSFFACFGKSDYKECVNQDQFYDCVANRRCKSTKFYEDDEGKPLKGKDLTDCVKEEVNKQKKTKVVGGTIDKDLLPTTVKFVKSKSFPSTVISNEYLSFPLTLEVKNPRKIDFKAIASCEFKKGKEEVPGKEIGRIKFERIGEMDKATINCQPSEELGQGKWQIEYKVLFEELNSVSRLYRAFIGIDKTPEWKEDELPAIMTTHFPGKEHLSKAPADLAKFHFAFGNPLENPIISTTEGVLISSRIENGGRGRIAQVRKYSINLPGFGVDRNCLQGENIIPPAKLGRQAIFLPTCKIDSFPLDLENPIDYEYRQFEASITYDYEMTHKAFTDVQGNVVSEEVLIDPGVPVG